jgi:hypothetical protein
MRLILEAPGRLSALEHNKQIAVLLWNGDSGFPEDILFELMKGDMARIE